jgi:hypothetical protein
MSFMVKLYLSFFVNFRAPPAADKPLKVLEEGCKGEPDFRAIAPFGHIFRVSFALQYAYTASVCFLESTPKPSH